MAKLVYEWNVWETQTMVLLSFMLQLFLLATGSLRRRHINGVLKALIWLAYLGADFVAIYALGLFSQYEDKYKLGRDSFGDTLPFLWVPFLLVHLGGQDSITAFSLEDNNLWLRHSLNLTTQGVVALYVFWKSFHRISYSILVPAMFVFLSGIIKYGERVWALKSASRNGLGELVKLNSPAGQNDESYALQTVLLARGLFVGRTLIQLRSMGNGVLYLGIYKETEKRLRMVVMELGMMFDLLYTKANVLQRWTGVLFRCASQALMLVAFVLFLISEKGAHNHNRINVTITYTLFTGAVFMEACSIAVVMASPWTRAHLKEGRFLHRLCNFATFLFKVVQCNKRHRTSSSASVGQFNFMDYAIAMKYKPTILSQAICAIGLDKIWRNLWYVHHINDTSNVRGTIISSVLEIFDRLTDEQFRPLCLDRVLNFAMSQPFGEALYRLHLYTDLHISKHFAPTNSDVTPAPDDVMRLKNECEMLSNYMMYLMVVHPSMLSVNAAAQYLEAELVKWFTSKYFDGGLGTKPDILEGYVRRRLNHDIETCYPFEAAQINRPFDLKKSLEDIKEMWLRLLMYAAGKCHGELHARQLSEGGELITFVWLLMLHHGLGDVAQELRLWTSDDYHHVPRRWYQHQIFVSASNIDQQPEPLYAFTFRDQHAAREREHIQIQLERMVQDIVQRVLRDEQPVVEGTKAIGDLIQQFLSGETQLYGVTAPGGASEQDETSRDIPQGGSLYDTDDQVETITMQIEGSRHA